MSIVPQKTISCTLFLILLEFPYDTDVDKVRKVIKKVGLAMLEAEEYGQDFIRPLKS